MTHEQHTPTLEALSAPLDGINVSGELSLPIDSFKHLLSLVAHNPSRRARRYDLVRTVVNDGRPSDEVHLHLLIRPVGNRRNLRRMRLRFFQARIGEGDNTIERESEAGSDETIEDINSILNFLSAAGASTPLTARLQWNFPSGTRLNIPINYPVALPGDTGLSLVRGVRMTDQDYQQFVIVDSFSDGRVNLVHSLNFENSPSVQAINYAISTSTRTVNAVVREDPTA